MISIDLMEVLLRTVPQYFIFAALSFFIFSWINKKQLYSLIGEIILVVVGIMALMVMLCGYIPSPNTKGVDEEHLKSVINMVIFFCALGLLSILSLLIRYFRKEAFVPLIVLIFILSIVLFFHSTRLSRIKFELNRPTTNVVDSNQQNGITLPDINSTDK